MPVFFLTYIIMRQLFFILSFVLFILRAVAQEGDVVFAFLRYPASARANALGGNTLSLIERDPSLAFHNPALLGGEMDKMISFNYLNYISDINAGNALFAKALKERAAWGVGASFFSQGHIKGMSEEGISTGDLWLKDISLNGMFSYDLSDRWRGGVTLKFLYSGIADYTSLGLAVDAGLSYYHAEKDFSFGVALKQVGAQLKPYEDERQKMPWDIQAGITKRLAHAPVRFSLTAMYLNRWKMDYTDALLSEKNSRSFFKTLAKHLVFGIDCTPSENFWMAVGYNPKVASDMALKGGNAFAGFSGGAGVKIRNFDVGFSVAKFHPAALSMLLSVAVSFGH